MAEEDTFALQMAAEVISSNISPDAKAAALVFFNSDDFSANHNEQTTSLLSEAYIAITFGYDY